MLSMLKEALEWLNRAVQAREVAGQLRSCPKGWCKSSGVFALSGGFCRFHHAATTGSLKIGSSLNGAMVSRVM